MDPKHSQPLAASEKQEWLEFWQAPAILQELQKACRPAARTGLGCWAGWSGLGWAGLGWAGLAPLFLCKGWLPGGLGCWAGGWGPSCVSGATKVWECLGPIPDEFRRVPTYSDAFCESQKTHFFCCFGAAKPPKLVQNLSEPVGTRRIPSGMDPKHSQPLAASEKQEWLEFWQAQRFCRNYKKPVVQQLELGWAAGLVGLGWAGLAPLFLCKGWLPAGLGCWAGGWGPSCVSGATKVWECLGPIPDKFRRVPTYSDAF